MRCPRSLLWSHLHTHKQQTTFVTCTDSEEQRSTFSLISVGSKLFLLSPFVAGCERVPEHTPGGVKLPATPTAQHPWVTSAAPQRRRVHGQIATATEIYLHA